MIRVAPSILSADFAALAADVRRVEKAGADWLHVDVMDGHFVPNLTIGVPVVRALKPKTRLPLDVHLMLTHPLPYIEPFAKAGADWISFHVECENPVRSVIRAIRKAGARPGLTLKPGTDVRKLKPYLKDLDFVLVMTVEPGFGGQSFMPDMLPKIEALRDWRRQMKLKYLIEVDGGVAADTAAAVKKAGADVLVAGSAIFGQKNYARIIKTLKTV